MSTQGLPKGAHNGLLARYNIRADKDLGVGIETVRRIPCSYLACIFQLQKPRESRVTRKEKPRYSSSVGCKWWRLFDGDNDWLIVDLVPTSEACLEEIGEVQALVLGGLAVMMAEKGFCWWIWNNNET